MQHPSVIVRPGEKATFFSGRELIYPTEYDPPEVPNSTGNNNDWGDNDNNGGGIPVMPMTPAHPTAFETRQLGTIFNVEVTGISDDKSIVEMTVVPEIVDFDGFINYGTSLFVPMVSPGKGRKGRSRHGENFRQLHPSARVFHAAPDRSGAHSHRQYARHRRLEKIHFHYV